MCLVTALHAAAPHARPRLHLHPPQQSSLPSRRPPRSLMGTTTSPACSPQLRSRSLARCQAVQSALASCPPSLLTCETRTQACCWTQRRSNVWTSRAARCVWRTTAQAHSPRAPVDGVAGGPAGAQPGSRRCCASAPSSSLPELAQWRPGGRPLLVPRAAHRLAAGPRRWRAWWPGRILRRSKVAALARALLCRAGRSPAAARAPGPNAPDRGSLRGVSAWHQRDCMSRLTQLR